MARFLLAVGACPAGVISNLLAFPHPLRMAIASVIVPLPMARLGGTLAARAAAASPSAARP